MSTYIKTCIKIDNNWFRDEKYILKTSKLAFAIYTLMLERIGCDCKGYLNIDYLISHLGMNKNNCHMVDKIRKELSSLEEHGLVNFHENMYNDNAISFDSLKASKNTGIYFSIEPIKEKYTNIYIYEIFAILFSEYGDYQTKIGMLSQFCYIISCINSARNVCFPSMSNIMECATIGSHKTVKSHLDNLVELNLLIFKNPNLMNKNGSVVTQSPNYYARPMHEVELNAMVEERVSRSNSTPMSNNTSELGKLMRSLTQKINHIHDKEVAGTITNDDKVSLIEMAEEYNQLCISAGRKPRFNINARPKEVIIDASKINSLVVDNQSNQYKLNVKCDPFKETTKSSGNSKSNEYDPFDNGDDINFFDR